MPFIILLLSILLLANHSVSANITLKRYTFDDTLDIRLIYNYPYNSSQAEQGHTLGLIFINHDMSPRTLQVSMSDPFTLQRTVQLAAQSNQRLFFYFPHFNFYSGTFTVSDLSRGLNKEYGYRINSTYYSSTHSQQYYLARYEKINSPLNIDFPWKDAGLLDEQKIPDNWKGLMGITAIVTESQYLERLLQSLTIREWITMGGIIFVIPTTPFSLSVVTQKLAFTHPKTPFVWQSGLGYVITVQPRQIKLIDKKFLTSLGIKAPYLTSSPYPAIKSLRKNLDRDSSSRKNNLFFFLLLFALFVGPITWYFLVKRHARPFLYISIVIGTSTILSVSLIVLTFLIEGISVIGKYTSVRFIDFHQDVEIQLQQAIVYAPSHYNTAISIPFKHRFILFPYQNQYSDFNKHYTISYTPLKRILHNILPIRQEKLLATIGIDKTQGKLLFQTTEHGLQVENHYPAKINTLEVWHDGHYYAFQEIPFGGIAKSKKDPTTFKKNLLQHYLNTQAKHYPLSNITGQSLQRAISTHQLGTRHFSAQIQTIQQTAFIFPKGHRVQSTQHLLIGIY